MVDHLLPFHFSASIFGLLPIVPTATHIRPVGQETAASRSTGFAALAAPAASRTRVCGETGAAEAA